MSWQDTPKYPSTISFIDIWQGRRNAMKILFMPGYGIDLSVDSGRLGIKDA